MVLKTSLLAAWCSSPAALTLSKGARPGWPPTAPFQCLPSRERRGYATVKDDDGSDAAKARRWAGAQHGTDLPSWPRSASPTPYEILGIAKSAPYTKARFYQLAKLYHPDTHDRGNPDAHPSQQIPHAVRLERYHLIVAAHDLLSDPSKRQLYDVHGTGWSGTTGRPPSPSEAARQADRSWRQQPGNAAHNATWEDWERWYDERDGRAARPRGPDSLHMPNGVFAAIVVMLCMVGALAQKSRADSAGTYYVETRAQQDKQIGGDVMKSTAAMAGHSKDARIETFMRDRENVAYDYTPKKYDDSPEP